MQRSKKSLIGLSKFLSLLLRHKPEILNLEMNESGFVSLKELLRKIPRNSCWNWVTEGGLERVIREDPKGRFEVKEKGGEKYVRATYGHSARLPVSIDYPEQKPAQKFLYHGTKKRNVEAILQEGLKPKSRKYVHLTTKKGDAITVAERRSGKNVILKVNAWKFYSSGGVVLRATSQLYLCPQVPPKFIEVLDVGTVQ
ncbi:MAG: RNA 2'-phosphotransferase [Candidatus Korarchaeota archaeon]|nr:RNA 2'-phosphotransferase [Candidatus Korarchaeota archaeon]NIU81889.1 RNA 2'-phosphotransferase [Candidatus Thorarchaeota archaeon]NIW12342.1 RNA 2'-phosphotransferase [Candidatus Thorarchaeota archaeon]NIW50619.1 RNA 2'-phosphotransferase [Candidatus Korarchaeota archaeon]